MINQIKWVVVILFFLVGAVLLSYFIENNSTALQLKLVVPFFGIAHQTYPLSVSWIVISSFIFGFVASAAIMLIQLIRNWFQIRRLQRENSALQRLMDRQETVAGEVSKSLITK